MLSTVFAFEKEVGESKGCQAEEGIKDAAFVKAKEPGDQKRL